MEQKTIAVTPKHVMCTHPLKVNLTGLTMLLPISVYSRLQQVTTVKMALTVSQFEDHLSNATLLHPFVLTDLQ